MHRREANPVMCGFQIFSVWSGIMGFERSVLRGQVEHDLLIAIRKPKRETKMRLGVVAKASTHAPSCTCSIVKECISTPTYRDQLMDG